MTFKLDTFISGKFNLNSVKMIFFVLETLNFKLILLLVINNLNLNLNFNFQRIKILIIF